MANKMIALAVCGYLFVIVILATTVSASTFMTRVSVHKDHPGMCWFRFTQRAVAVGDSVHIPGECYKLTCGPDLRFTGDSCPTVEMVDSNCEVIPMDLTQKFPKCCERYRCVTEQGDNFIVEP